MDIEGPTSTVGRTFWTVWYYITGAINRFFQPEASNNFTNEPNSFQEPAVDNECAACGHMEEDINKKEVEEEQPITTLTEQSSRRPVAAWELCSSEGHGQPDVSEPQYKTQLTDSQDKASIKGDDARAGDLAQTVDVERFHLEDGQQKGDRIQSLHTDGQGEMQENGGCLNNRSVNSKEDTDLTSGERRGNLHRTDAASLQEKEPPLVECGKQEMLFDAVTTGIKHLEEETETTSKDLRGGTEGFLAEIEKNRACEVNAYEGDQETQEVVMFTDETGKFFEDKKQEVAETSSRSPSLLEDLSESGLVRQEVGTEPTCLEENTAEMLDVGLNLEEFGFKDDKIVSKDKSKSKNENLAVGSLSESNTASGNNSVGESEAQQSKMKSNDTISKSTAKDMTVILAEGTENHVTMIYTEETSLSSAQEVIDEETIDPCIQTLSQDTDGVKWQEEPEPGQQMGWKIEPLNSEGDGIPSDLTESMDQFVELSQSGGSEFRIDAGMSSCTDQSTFWDDARCESGAPKGQSHLWTLNITGSLLGTTSDTLESDVSKCFIPGPSTECLDILTEEISEIEQSHPREAGDLSQEMLESQRNFNEESGSQSDVEITDHTGQTEKQLLKEDIQSSTEMDTFVQVTKVNEDTLKDTAANSGDEVEDAGSGPSRSSSKVSTECASQGDAESSRLLKLALMGTAQVGLSEDYVDALPKPNRTQVTTHLTKGTRNQIEVHTSVLDSSPQKSKIAVKNPRVRPPKDPRSLLHMPSLNPTPPSHPPAKKPVGFPVGALGIGIKLPGLSGGLPVLKKTQPKELEPKPASMTDAPEDERKHKPKWMPPQQPGFGNPLMSELKIKLKKTARDNEL